MKFCSNKTLANWLLSFSIWFFWVAPRTILGIFFGKCGVKELCRILDPCRKKYMIWYSGQEFTVFWVHESDQNGSNINWILCMHNLKFPILGSKKYFRSSDYNTCKESWSHKSNDSNKMIPPHFCPNFPCWSKFWDSLVLPKTKFAKEEFWSPFRSELPKAVGQKDVKKYVVVTW